MSEPRILLGSVVLGMKMRQGRPVRAQWAATELPRLPVEAQEKTS